MADIRPRMFSEYRNEKKENEIMITPNNTFYHWLEVAYADNADRNDLERHVAEIILSEDDALAFIYDALDHGCISGIVSELIYYTDTRTFYDRYYSDIEILRNEYQSMVGEPLVIQGHDDLKNMLAWFAFEQVCANILNEYLDTKGD